ncbi:MAG: hypothetical protein H6713_42030 [Myxococcales bacterium]|nr:hypothetical protein [Myxococcales bacterium]MCB9756541.1 hypothetical protein [Myxococcales bacterium]
MRFSGCEAGDNTIPGSLEVREVYTVGSLRRGVLFLWRPDEALAPNHEYQLELSAAYGHVGSRCCRRCAGAGFRGTHGPSLGKHI